MDAREGRCACGHFHDGGADDDPEFWTLYRQAYALDDHAVLPLRCARCAVDLDISLPSYDLHRPYYCVEHCPTHVYEDEYDSCPTCRHCGLSACAWMRERLTHLMAMKTALQDAAVVLTALYWSDRIPGALGPLLSPDMTDQIVAASNAAWAALADEAGLPAPLVLPVPEDG